MSINHTQLKAQSISELMYSINVCNKLSGIMRRQLNSDIPTDAAGINELITLFNVGGLEAAIQYLSALTDTHVDWIEKNSTDKQA